MMNKCLGKERVGERGKQNSSYAVERGGTGDKGEEQPGVRGLPCGVLRPVGGVQACAATEG